MRSIGLLLLVSTVAFGQRAGVARPAGRNTFGSASGFGNVVFPGTGHAPVPHRPINGGGIGLSGGAVGTYRGGRSVIYVPYTVPLYFGEPNEPQITVMYPTPQIAPQVVINQNFAPVVARPIVREYVSDSDGGIRVYEPAPAPSPAPAPTQENPTYLIAFKDHTIYAAVAYWVEGDTLHYVTNQNTHNQVSLDLIDRELSLRLNRERTVDFRLPPRRSKRRLHRFPLKTIHCRAFVWLLVFRFPWGGHQVMKKVLLIAAIGIASSFAQPFAGGRGFGGPMGGPGMRPARPVVGSPYSAVEVRTTQQVLANGNTIQRQQQVTVSRDSQGRTRTETTVQQPGRAANTRIAVADPVSGVIRNIDHQNRAVREMTLRQAPGGRRGGTNLRPGRGPNPNRPANANVQTENLGTQTLNGVLATGTRVTRTIPAGAEGNAQPIQSIRETWVSEDLKGAGPIMVKTTDPRFGTTVTQLTNIVRAEPDPALFQAPAGYSVTKVPMGPGGRQPRAGGGQKL